MVTRRVQPRDFPASPATAEESMPAASTQTPITRQPSSSVVSLIATRLRQLRHYLGGDRALLNARRERLIQEQLMADIERRFGDPDAAVRVRRSRQRQAS